MHEDLILAAKELLKQPVELLEIPVQRAVTALGISSLSVGHDYYHMAEFLIYPKNLYLSFPKRATRDKNGNYDSPIFQHNFYNSLKPFWQTFREQLETERGTSIDRIFFGNYVQLGPNEEHFIVTDEPKDARWLYLKNTEKNTTTILALTDAEIAHYQAILDDMKLARAITVVQDRRNRDESRACRENAIAYLQSKYHDTTDRFNFGEETFKFRQFNIEWLYISSDLQRFDDFYLGGYLPYKLDELSGAEWRKISNELEYRLLSDRDFKDYFIMENVHGFRFRLTDDGRCEVLSDMLDDLTGQDFCLVVDSQDPETIYDIVVKKLEVVFQRKEQLRRAAITLQKLSSVNH